MTAHLITPPRLTLADRTATAMTAYACTAAAVCDLPARVRNRMISFTMCAVEEDMSVVDSYIEEFRKVAENYDDLVE